MNGELVPAAVAVGGGTALIGGIFLYERRRDDAMRASRGPRALRFPAALELKHAQAALTSLHSLPHTAAFLAEVVADHESVRHSLAIPAVHEPAGSAGLIGAIPSLRVSNQLALSGTATVAARMFVPKLVSLRTSEIEAASRMLLTGLAGLNEGEVVVIRWALRPDSAPLLGERHAKDAATKRVWKKKTDLPGFTAAGLILVRAGSKSRARTLLEHVAGTYRSRRGELGYVRMTLDSGGRSLAAEPRVTRSSGWLNAAELMGLLGWPVGDVAVPGVEVGAARELPVRRDVPREGRRLFLGRDANGEREVALSVEAARHHVLIAGPSGVGKSTLVARGILDHIQAGHAGAVIDPLADLVQTVLDRVPEEHADRVVVLDPSATTKVPGISVLSAGDPELRSDVIVGALRQIFASSWGIRSDVYLRLGIRSLAEVPGATLADLGRLFFERTYRHSVIARLRDPVLVSTWQHFESLSAAEQAQYVASPMSKIQALMGRPSVRSVLASPDPKLDIAKLFSEGKWLMGPLAPGLIGEQAAHLIGAVVMYVIWSAVEARAALPPERRTPLFLFIDELATLSALPFGFELLAERARGLGAGLTVAAQSLARLPDQTRAALLGNVASLICFRQSADEATRLAKELPGLSALDLQSLGRFEVAARIGTGLGSSVAVMTGRTEPLPEVTGQAEHIRMRSALRYGTEIETLDVREETEPKPEEGQRGRKRRQS